MSFPNPESPSSGVRVCFDTDDKAWDSFLEGSTLGHFHQSSLWAKAKAVDGWRPVRRVLTRDDRIVGGFQMLEKRGPWGRMGYIYKGPVVEGEEPAVVERVVQAVVETARACAVRALIVQPPDASMMSDPPWSRHGFLPNHLVATISATLVVDLSGGLEEVRKRMRRTTRAEIRQASERGIRVRPGGKEDIALFFSLMADTCERQKSSPSPDRADALQAVWDAFHPSGKARLFLAECEGDTVAGLLCLCFGRRVVAWKRGWSGAYGDRNPNQLVNYEAIKWAVESGYQVFDFDAMDREMAETLLRGDALSDSQKRSRHFINLAYGSRPVLLPASQVYIPSAFLRSCYRLLFSWKHL